MKPYNDDYIGRQNFARNILRPICLQSDYYCSVEYIRDADTNESIQVLKVFNEDMKEINYILIEHISCMNMLYKFLNIIKKDKKEKNYGKQ